MDIKTKQSALTKYHIDPDTKKPITVPVIEKQQVHPLKNLIQMVGEVKKNKKIQIIDRDMIPVNKPEKITQPYHYYVDYEQNLIHFHPDVAGQTIEYKYDDMGVTVISANKIFTKQDNYGNVVELLEDIIESGREAIDVMITIGGVAVIMKKLEDYIEEGCEVCEKIQADIQQAKDEVLNVRGNKEVIIRTSDWIANIDVYEKEISHDLNSENLHITAKNSDNKEAVTIGYKILSKSKVLLKSDEAINMSVVLSASYYHATQTVSDNIAEEVIKARKGESGLDVKITKIDEEMDMFAREIMDLEEDSNINTTNITNITNSLNSFQSEVNTKIENLKDETYYKINSLYYVRNCEELISALNTAKTKPSKIYILNDIELTNIAFIPSNTHVEGLGSVTITVSDSLNAGFINYTTNNPSGYDGSENITIKNITFDALNRSSGLTLVGFGHAKNITIENCNFKNLHMWHMIELNACLNAQILGCDFTNYGTIGENATEVIQLDSMISASQFPWFGSYDGVGNRNVLIDSCYFKNVGNKCIGGHSFKQGSIQRNITISNCEFDTVQTAIEINDFENLKITNNNAYSCHTFFFSKCVNNACVGLTITNNNVSGAGHLSTNLGDIRFVTINPDGSLNNLNYYNVTIANNIIKDIPSHGIGITANNVTIANNKFNYVHKNGIYFYGGNMCSIIGNTFSDCGLENNSRYAIVVGNNAIGSVRVTISNNCVSNFRGIKIFGYSNVVIVTNNCVPVISSDLTSGYTEANNILS